MSEPEAVAQLAACPDEPAPPEATSEPATAEPVSEAAAETPQESGDAEMAPAEAALEGPQASAEQQIPLAEGDAAITTAEAAGDAEMAPAEAALEGPQASAEKQIPLAAGDTAIATAEAADYAEMAPAELALEGRQAPAEQQSPLADGDTAIATAEAPPEPAPATQPEPNPVELDDTALKAVVEAVVYVTEEPVTPAQIATALAQPEESVHRVLEQLAAEFNQPGHGICLREVAGGYKMATKAEHHEAIRAFAKTLKPPLKLSLAALETLATIAYKQPVTAPEIMAIRGVQGAGVLKTLLDRKLIAVAGRKNVIGRPMLYKTTKDFLVQFGLKDLSELPTLKEFEELRRMAVGEDEPAPSAEEAAETAPPGGGDPQENA